MKKLSLLFVFAAMFAFVSCGPSAEKKTEEVKTETEEVMESIEAEIDTLQQDVEEGTETIETEIEVK